MVHRVPAWNAYEIQWNPLRKVLYQLDCRPVVNLPLLAYIGLGPHDIVLDCVPSPNNHCWKNQCVIVFFFLWNFSWK